jgi:hypothetical protein
MAIELKLFFEGRVSKEGLNKEKGGQREVARPSTSKLAEMGRSMLRPYKETGKEKSGQLRLPAGEGSAAKAARAIRIFRS